MVAKIIMGHEATIASLMLRKFDLSSSMLADAMTRMYEEIFSLQLYTFRCLRRTGLNKLLSNRSLRTLNEYWHSSTLIIEHWDRLVKYWDDQMIHNVELIFSLKQPLSGEGKLRDISQDLAGSGASIGAIQDLANPTPAERIPAMERAERQIPLERLQLLPTTGETWEQKSEKVEETQQELAHLLSGNENVEAAGWAASAKKEEIVQVTQEHLPSTPKTDLSGDNTNSSDERSHEREHDQETAIENNFQEETKGPETKPTREEELSAEIADMKKEMLRLRKENQELRGLVQK